jgi:hypothetical protein
VSEGTGPDGLQQPGLGPSAPWSGPRGGGRSRSSVCQSRHRRWETHAGGKAPAPAGAVANLTSGRPWREAARQALQGGLPAARGLCGVAKYSEACQPPGQFPLLACLFACLLAFLALFLGPVLPMDEMCWFV